ncbi:MAG: hypothetical protein ACOC9Y_07545 [Chloroflexota bacterium]
MTDLLYVALVVFLAANAPAAARVWKRTIRVSIGIDRFAWTLGVCAVTVIAGVLFAMFAESIIDLFGVSLPTFKIAAGVLLLLGVIPVFVPATPRDPNPPDRAIWPALRLLLWLASPSVLFAIVALSADLGSTHAASGTVVGVAGAAIMLLIALRFESHPVERVFVWLSWLLAAVLVVIAAELIRQGVQTV